MYANAIKDMLGFNIHLRLIILKKEMDEYIEAYNKMEKKVVEFLSKQEHVKLAYLFGSVAEGKEGKLSDVDLAVFLDESLSKKEIFNLQLKLISELTSVLKIDKVDLTVMNNAPLLLKYNIIKHGKILKQDIEIKIRVESEILSDYLDMKYFIDRHTNLAIKRIAKEGLL